MYIRIIRELAKAHIVGSHLLNFCFSKSGVWREYASVKSCPGEAGAAGLGPGMEDTHQQRQRGMKVHGVFREQWVHFLASDHFQFFIGEPSSDNKLLTKELILFLF